jgi:N-acyl homoserine lactone hydrolase
MISIRSSSAALLALALFTLTGCDPTLAAAPPHANVAPRPTSTPVGLCWLEYARDTFPGSYGVAGGSRELEWEVTFSGLLVRHPSGDLLVDVGNSSHFSEERATSSFLPGLLQKIVQGSARVLATAPDALRAVGEEPATLKAIVISHAHADHAGGVMDLPSTPILVSPEELSFIAREKDQGGFDVVKAQAAAIEGRARAIQFTHTPYENFDESADYFGDGSVVFVPLAGHTPGSIGTFVNRSPGERYFHVGDAANTREAVELRRGKSVVVGFTDDDSTMADAVVAKLNQLRAQDPGVVIVPAHDRKVWQSVFGAPGCLGERR